MTLKKFIKTVSNINNIEKPEIEVRIATTQKEVDEYCNLRKKIFLEGETKYEIVANGGERDDFDDIANPNSYIFVAYKGGACIGGARMITKKVGESHLLPSEKNGYSFTKLLPDLYLSGLSFGELSRFVTVEDHGALTSELCHCARMKSIELELGFIVGVATKVRSRIYRIITKNYISSMKIRKDIDVSRYYTDGKERFINVLDLRAEYEGVNWEFNNEKRDLSYDLKEALLFNKTAKNSRI